MKSLMNNQKGFGLLEVLIGFGILSIGAFIILQGLDFIDDKQNVVNQGAAQESMVSGIVESVRANISMEKIDFEPQDFLGNTTYDSVHSSLKLCWIKDGIIPLETYPECPGRMGYVVTPLKIGSLELRGLHKVTLRITHKELFPNQFKQYEFIVKDP